MFQQKQEKSKVNEQHPPGCRQKPVANFGPLLRGRLAQPSKLFNKCCWKLKINKKRMKTAHRDL